MADQDDELEEKLDAASQNIILALGPAPVIAEEAEVELEVSNGHSPANGKDNCIHDNLVDREQQQSCGDRAGVVFKQRLLCLPPQHLGEETDTSDWKEAPFSGSVNPDSTANLLSRYTYWWFNPLMDLGYRQPLMNEHLWHLEDEHSANNLANSLERCWNDQLLAHEEVRAFVRCYWWEYLAGVLPRLLKMGMGYIGPFILKEIINFMTVPDLPFWYGLLLIAILFLATVISSLALNRFWHVMVTAGMRVRTSAIGLIYRKALRLSAHAKQTGDTGKVMNLISTDSSRLQDVAFYFHFTWQLPVLIISTFFLEARLLGFIPVLSAYGALALMVPLSFLLARKLDAVRKANMEKSDARVKASTEIFQSIKSLKLYALVDTFRTNADGLRDKELSGVWIYQMLKAVQTALNYAVIPVMSTIAFVVFIYSGEELSAAVAFSAIALFSTLKYPFAQFTGTVAMVVEALVSITRMEEFLMQEEAPTNKQDPQDEDDVDLSASTELKASQNGKEEEVELSIKNASFYWDKSRQQVSDPPTLENVTLDLKDRKEGLICIIGKVGAGKSSFLSAICGELFKTDGELKVSGDICYAPQTPFLLHATVKENILFGKEMDLDRYMRVVDSCGLSQDLASLVAGDETRIGERGINLSGGQKARVGLARAIYQDGDVYLLDDVLGSLDAVMGNKVFWRAIKQSLASKLVLLVTHQLQYLSNADHIVIMDNGRITQQGSYEELTTGGVDFQALLDKFNVAKQEGPADQLGASTEKADAAPRFESKTISAEANKANTQKDEEREVGGVSLQVYLKYFSFQPVLWAIALASIVLFRSGDIGQNFWLARWSNLAGSGLTPEDTQFYMWSYTIITVIGVFLLMLQEWMVATAGLRSGRALYGQMMTTLSHAVMKFFDTTPKGRIISRISNDTDNLDNAIAATIAAFLSTVILLLGTILVVCLSSPWFLLLVAPLVLVACRFYFVFVAVYREITRVRSITSAPIFSLFNESLNGMFTIRAFNQQVRFRRDFEALIDSHQKSFYFSFVCNRWLGLRLDTLAGIITIAIAMLAIFSRGAISPGLVGVAFSYALNSGEILNAMIRTLSEVESKMNSVERFVQYSNVETERKPRKKVRLPKAWPAQGVIEFRDVQMRYREGLPLVLKGLTFKIDSGQKVGIVGRTGAGKSSILSTLFRLSEIESGQGAIVIDEIDIGDLRVETLRSKISVIPQDPVIFDGTVRRNLDPTNIYSDDELWGALKRAHLEDAIKKLQGGLDGQLAEEGANLSIGEKQLLCIARALLRNTKILFLDEASAGIDLQTDHVLQETIRREFSKCTILTIAHRIQTILDCDKILVLNDGKVAEYDSPAELLKNPKSLFTKLHNSSVAGN